jgi:hypothetical protein
MKESKTFAFGMKAFSEEEDSSSVSGEYIPDFEHLYSNSMPIRKQKSPLCCA